MTGFFFPLYGVTPAIVLGIISLLLLAIAIVAQYARHLIGAWRWISVVTAMISLYLNVFVLIVQLFQKVPGLKSLAPTQSEPPFAVTQLVVLRCSSCSRSSRRSDFAVSNFEWLNADDSNY